VESQSGRGLPLVYEPFDAAEPAHWEDRGLILDFAECAGTGQVLDFGPGDGWPALPMAQLVGEVVGVESCERRAGVCRQNARRMGIGNVEFVVVEAGQPLPFAEGSFDAVTAASSAEQTPDPRATLEEFFRVLRPGGALRLRYEALERYRGDEEQASWPIRTDGEGSRLIIVDRDIDAERADRYGLVFDMPHAELCGLWGGGLTPAVLANVQFTITRAVHWQTRHPACGTWLRWLQEIGFRASRPTARAAPRARALFERIPPEERPGDLAGVDALLRPVVRRALEEPAVVEPAEAPVVAFK
jgi:SAM-dependent methyltransferase